MTFVVIVMLELLDKVVEWILWVPILPLLVIATLVGVILGLNTSSRKKEMKERIEKEEARLMAEVGAQKPSDFKSMVEKAQEVDKMKGETAQYRWTQSCHEMEMFIPVPADTTRSHVQCSFTSSTFTMSIAATDSDSSINIAGAYYERVVPDDCNWQLDGDGATRVVWVILQKAAPTVTKKHWPCVVQGHVELSQPGATTGDADAGSGPPVHHIDSSDPAAMIAAMQSLKGFRDSVGIPSGPGAEKTKDD